MTISSSSNLLRLAAFGLVLLTAQCTPKEGPDRKLAEDKGLEDYMRYTPPPTPPTEESATTPKPTDRPTAKPTEAPTEAPTGAPTRAPSNSPTSAAPTNKPTEEPTKPPKRQTDFAVIETSPPTPAPSAEAKEDEEAQTTTPSAALTESSPIVIEQEAQPTEDQWDLFSDALLHQESIGEVFVDFSLYSPNVTNLEMNFMKLKMGVCGSIDGLVCDQGHPVKERGPEYCAVRDDVLLRSGPTSRQNPLDLSDHDVTVMALSSTNVKDASGIIQGTTSISWTTWRMSWSVLKLGPALEEHIAEEFGPDLTEEAKNIKGLGLLQKMMTVEMERTIRNGVLQDDLNNFMKEILLLTSVVGEEASTYGAVMLNPGTSAAKGSELANGEDGEGGGLMVVFFFAGLGVACFVIVTLLYFSFRSRRSVVRRKRTIVILDDTSKDCTDSQESSSDRVIVIDTQSALEEDAPRAQQEPADEQQWGGESSVGGGEADDGDGDAEGDAESQWGRSTAVSAYTGSISAITGVSGLENSDTWSVGSMSIDLAEWG